MLKAITTTAKAVLQAAGSVVGVRQGTEEPAYRVEQLTSNVQIRRYGQRIAAETTVAAGEEAARSIGFRRLAGYIFGGNNTATKIAMTAPVAEHAGTTGQWVIRFFLPADKTMAALPQPNDPDVRIVGIPAETLAVRRFTGDRSPLAIAANTAKLLDALRELGFEPTGAPAAWFYDPPWTVAALRRNEIAIPVADRL
ncbi:heme-binding protein [Mycobacterium sp. M1]|uniref:Heme-binding protein n=1 Tax=Mycolicibacter acidiphilus TaxID=2835306 RepID=A0ABS5RNM2_9MYCO|nr:heme-binding protein [Mycolicibacter acidiphilus]MBS9535907.1 heme-binding protein [Mycolicibacter acidiphilus]